jgi:hypothetical protein
MGSAEPASNLGSSACSAPIRLVSVPGAQELRLDALVGSPLPAQLAAMGYGSVGPFGELARID